MRSFNWKLKTDEQPIVLKIVDRAYAMAQKHAAGKPMGERDKQDWRMDIIAVHNGDCPLRLQDMLDADDFNFAHDIFGIARHLNRTTMKLEDHFLPRFSA